jgi:hypothetical protein
MYLLLDECCGKALVGIAERAGHTAQRTVEVAMLGRQAPDLEIFEFARQVGAVFVTVNRGDFIALAGHTRAVTVNRDQLSEGFRHFVSSTPAPVASGWSGCRVGLAPTGKRRLLTAHTHCGRCSFWLELVRF